MIHRNLQVDIITSINSFVKIIILLFSIAQPGLDLAIFLIVQVSDSMFNVKLDQVTNFAYDASGPTPTTQS